MDKRNYTLREIEIQALKENCSLMKSKLINELENRVLKRKRVLKSLELLITAIFLYITEKILKAVPVLVEWVFEQ